MDTYIGTTQVKAEQMLMGEAYEKNLLKAGQVPSEDEKLMLGYLVELEDGYQFWMPYSDFVDNYRHAENFLQRLHIEHDELYRRLHKLKSFLDSDNNNKIGYDMLSLMKNQYHAMSLYLEILEERLDRLEPKNTCSCDSLQR